MIGAAAASLHSTYVLLRSRSSQFMVGARSGNLCACVKGGERGVEKRRGGRKEVGLSKSNCFL